jgi:hypothetical protein
MILFIFLGIWMGFNSLINISYAEDEKNVKLQELIDIGIKNSKEIKGEELLLLEKEIEEKQLNEKIMKMRDLNKPINILKNEELIKNLLDLNKIRNEAEDIRKNVDTSKGWMTKEIRIKYLEAAYQENLVKMLTERNEQAEKKLEELKIKFKTGQISGDIFLLEEDKIKKIKETLENALLDDERALSSLNTLIGEEISKDKSLVLELTTIDLKEISEDDLLEQVYLNDENLYFTLLKKYENEVEIATLLKDEKQQQGNIFKEIHKCIEAGNKELSKIVDAYDTLYKSELPNKKLYRFIPINHFILPLDEGYTGELKDYWHFNNEKYSISLALVEKEKLSNEYDKRKSEVKERIEASLLNIKKNIKTLEQLKGDYEKARLKYDNYLLDMKKGIIQYDQLIEAQEIKEDIYQKLLKAMIDINRLLFNLSYDSGGWLEDYIWNEKISSEGLALGEEFSINKKEAKENSKRDNINGWNIKQKFDTGQMKFSILKLPEHTKITGYSLRTYENVNLSSIVAIDASFLRKPSILKEFATGYIYVDFYEGEKRVGSALIDGFSNGGEFMNYRKIE